MNINCFFAGQGAQFPGMGKDLAIADSEIMSLFDEANDVLGFDLKEICFEGSAEALTASDICQPAIFVTSVACYKSFLKKCPNVKFSAVAGLSLGEWTALYAAGVLDFASTLKVLQARGRFMQEACVANPSGMVSIMGASSEVLDKICAESGCSVSNINSDAQQVLSGTHESVAKAVEVATSLGVKNVVLQVAGAFHSHFMQSAREKLTTVLAPLSFESPKIPVLSNATGTFHSSDGETIKEIMLKQVTDTVHFSDCVRAVMNPEGSKFVEFGPGKVLSGLIRRIDKTNEVMNVQDCQTLTAVAEKLNA